MILTSMPLGIVSADRVTGSSNDGAMATAGSIDNDLLAKEKVMNDEAILFGGNKAMIDDFEQELSPNFGEWD